MKIEFDYKLSFEGFNLQLPLRFTGNFMPGHDGRGPDLHQPGEPPEAAEFDITSIEIYFDKGVHIINITKAAMKLFGHDEVAYDSILAAAEQQYLDIQVGGE